MKLPEQAVVLINIGTPDSPQVKDVRKFLSHFLNDKRVIDIPWILRKMLVNLIIVPFRAPHSAKLYKLLWTDKGSPLQYVSDSVGGRLQELLGNSYRVFTAMRYGKPGLGKILKEIHAGGYRKIIILPLFPQYASSTTGTAVSFVMDNISSWNIIPEVKLIGQFYDNPLFVNAFAKRINDCKPETYDHIVFSYHGLPNSHINRIHPDIDSQSCRCTETMPEFGQHCYKAVCYETTRLIAAVSGLKKGTWSVGFQSRLSDKWLKPFTGDLLVEKAGKGMKKILIVAPSFVTDCLETIVELGIEYRKLFIDSGGTRLDYVESLNDMPEWISAMKEMITSCDVSG